MSIEYKLINGFRVFGFQTQDELIAYVKKSPSILIAANGEKIYSKNTEIKNISLKNIGYADGIGAVYAIRKKGLKKAVRIPGSELWLRLISQLHTDNTFYLIGSTTEVVTEVVKRLQVQFPKINIVGYRNGYLRSEEEVENLELDIQHLKPDVVFVAQGSPRQEVLMQRIQNSHKAIYMGLGGSFDVYTGFTKRAPKIFRNYGLEWLYRLLSQPSRIKRYKVLLPFAINVIRGKY